MTTLTPALQSEAHPSHRLLMIFRNIGTTHCNFAVLIASMIRTELSIKLLPSLQAPNLSKAIKSTLRHLF